MRALGADNFSIQPICSCSDKSTLDKMECLFIEEYHSVVPFGYNLMKGGGGVGGHHPNTLAILSEKARKENLSPERIEKMSKAKLGKKQPKEVVDKRIKTGWKHKESTTDKISKSHLGLVASEETRKKQSESAKKRVRTPGCTKSAVASNIGRPCSEEKKRKISEANTGKKRTQEQKDKIAASLPTRRPVIDNEGRVFLSIKEAAAHLGVLPSSISAAVRGKVKTCKGFIFKYYFPNPSDPSQNP
jgi:hypothetical protein